MTRGKRPIVAIGEAKRSAVAAGFVLVELITEAELAFDFVVHRDRITSLVRVRRLKQAGFRVANIMRACAQPIAELQSCTLPDQLVRELWVRGPARAYHRYRVLPDTVEELGIVAMPRSSQPGLITSEKRQQPESGGNQVNDVSANPVWQTRPAEVPATGGGGAPQEDGDSGG